jgi:hypothetical protein
MFIVSYLADQGVTAALRELTRRGVTLLVRSSDPNITEDSMCELCGIDPYYIELLSASAGRSYDQLVLVPDDRQSAALACNGRLEGAAHGISVCRRLAGAGRMMLIVQTVLGVIGFIFTAVAAFLAVAMHWGLWPLYIMAFMIVSCIVTCLLPILTRRS